MQCILIVSIQPAPMSTTSSHSQLYALFFFFLNYKPLSSISVAHMDMGMGPTLRHGELTRGHATKGE